MHRACCVPAERCRTALRRRAARSVPAHGIKARPRSDRWPSHGGKVSTSALRERCYIQLRIFVVQVSTASHRCVLARRALQSVVHSFDIFLHTSVTGQRAQQQQVCTEPVMLVCD